MNTQTLSRRTFLRAAALSGGAALLNACATNPGSNMMGNMGHGSMGGTMNQSPAGMLDLPYLNMGRPASATFKPDLDLAITARQADVQLMDGKPTRAWTYASEVIGGDRAAVQTLPETYLGPVIRARTGQKLRVRFTNALPEKGAASVIHWHGLHVPADMDGHPSIAIAPGQTYVYEFEVMDRAGTYWFHPHPHGDTARQVYLGMAGMLIVSDDEERSLNLPSGELDIPLILQDRTFDKNNQLVYLGMGMMGGMMEQMMGFLGDRIVVNGKPDFTLNAATRAYRLRLLNGSNARIYKLAWSDGSPLTLIGADGGLLEKPIQKAFLMLSPGERAEVFADFSGRKVGGAVKLVSLPFEGAENVPVPASLMPQMNGVQQMMMQGETLPLGAAFDVMTVKIVRAELETFELPQRLSTIGWLNPANAANAASPREFAISHTSGVWLMNGRQFGADIAPEEQVKLNTTEVWEFVNALNLGEMMDPLGMAHPIHLHGVRFQVIGRSVLPELRQGFDAVREGYLDEGWKDTFMLMPGERVKLLMQFRDFMGKFVYHCHNLEHEDQGLMRNYEVK